MKKEKHQRLTQIQAIRVHEFLKANRATLEGKMRHEIAEAVRKDTGVPLGVGRVPEFTTNLGWTTRARGGDQTTYRESITKRVNRMEKIIGEMLIILGADTLHAELKQEIKS